ncbi:MAG TPA: hypothetical protein VFZ23_01190 [Pyrinomonadaceae bacterium]
MKYRHLDAWRHVIGCPSVPAEIVYTGCTVDVGAFESGSTEASGSSSFAFGVLSARAWYTGSIAVLTDPITNEKRYAAVNAFGKGTFQNIPAGVYVLEIRSKRAGYGAVVLVEHDNNFASGRFVLPSPGL